MKPRFFNIINMTREEAIKELKEIQAQKDMEINHKKADKVLMKLLKSLGYSDVVKEYKKIDKWFA